MGPAPDSDDGFNEAAGIHRRKRLWDRYVHVSYIGKDASMRPPEFTGGNSDRDRCEDHAHRLGVWLQ